MNMITVIVNDGLGTIQSINDWSDKKEIQPDRFLNGEILQKTGDTVTINIGDNDPCSFSKIEGWELLPSSGPVKIGIW